MVARRSRGFAFGEAPTLADCCLVPQVYSAGRYNVDLTPFPAIRAAAEHAAQHPAFAAAHPDVQPDAAHA
jgi:maleylacetoacetate isomerase/maleylpyruvate isomerase